MTRSSRVLAIAVVFAAMAPPGAADAAKPRSNAVTRWVEASLDAVRVQNVGTPNAGRLYAMATAGMYDAVNGIDRARGHGRAHALVPASGAPVNGRHEVAAAAAAHAVLRGLLRADLPPVSDGGLDAALAAEIDAAGGAGDAPVAASRDWGRRVGQEVLARRAGDGSQAAELITACSRFADPVACDPGEFHASFDARWRHLVPFGIADATPSTSAGPPALDTAGYARAFHDVRTCGSSSAALDALCADPATPAERAEISSFWLAEGGTVRETGLWLQASLAIADEQGTIGSTSDSARLFALVAMAVADAVKVSWEAKATHFTWRPTTAIRRADTDGNAATDADATWTSRVASVGSSPEYTSGTSTFAGAASAAIEGFYCGTSPAFSFESDLASHGPRSYASPLEAAREAGRSRIFQGIHFQFSNEDGRRAGRAIGTEIAETRLLPVGNHQPSGCG